MMDILQQVTGNTPTIADAGLKASELWDEIQRLHVRWFNAGRSGDAGAAAQIERDFHDVAIAFAGLPVDVPSVSTGRKAIIRSIVWRLGSNDVDLLAALDAVIRREDAAARHTP